MSLTNDPTHNGQQAVEHGVYRSFQHRVFAWAVNCFGMADVVNVQMRRQRFLEESLELHQATGGSRYEAIALVEYVYNRPKGATVQEVGGVMVTLSTLCDAEQVDLEDAAFNEVKRVESMVEQIRVRHAAKPQFSGKRLRRFAVVGELNGQFVERSDGEWVLYGDIT